MLTSSTSVSGMPSIFLGMPAPHKSPMSCIGEGSQIAILFELCARFPEHSILPRSLYRDCTDSL